MINFEVRGGIFLNIFSVYFYDTKGTYMQNFSSVEHMDLLTFLDFITPILHYILNMCYLSVIKIINSTILVKKNVPLKL